MGLRLICQKQQQRQAITCCCSSIYKFVGLSSSTSCNPQIFRSSVIPNFQIHTLCRIANPNSNLNRDIIFKRLWCDDDDEEEEDLVSSEEEGTCYHMCVFSNCIGDRIHIDTINSEIYHCCEDNQVIYGFSLLAGIIKLGLVANRYTYCTLLVGLMSRNQFSEAKSLFDMLIAQRDIQPDMLTYETIIQVCFDMGYNLALDSFSMFLTYAKMDIRYEPIVIEY